MVFIALQQRFKTLAKAVFLICHESIQYLLLGLGKVDRIWEARLIPSLSSPARLILLIEGFTGSLQLSNIQSLINNFSTL